MSRATLRTPLCDLLGCEVPVVQTAMGWVAGPSLVAATTNAGGFGFLAGATIAADRMKGPMIRAMPKPLGGYAQPDDLTGIFEFLLAPEARFIVGQLIVADGGVESMWRGEDWPAPWDISMARFLFKLFGPR